MTTSITTSACIALLLLSCVALHFYSLKLVNTDPQRSTSRASGMQALASLMFQGVWQPPGIPWETPKAVAQPYWMFCGKQLQTYQYLQPVSKTMESSALLPEAYSETVTDNLVSSELKI